jgi:hypothetical protein
MIRRSTPIRTPLAAWANCVVYGPVLALFGFLAFALIAFPIFLALVYVLQFGVLVLVAIIGMLGLAVGIVVGLIAAVALLIANRVHEPRIVRIAIPLAAVAVTICAILIVACGDAFVVALLLPFGGPISLLGGLDIAKRYRASPSSTPVAAG